MMFHEPPRATACYVLLALAGLYASPVAAAGAVHVVRPGDTVYGIARLYHLKPQAVIAANRLNKSFTIAVGQKINIPQMRAMPATRVTRRAAAPALREDETSVAVAYTETGGTRVLPIAASDASTRIAPVADGQIESSGTQLAALIVSAPTLPTADETDSLTPPTPSRAPIVVASADVDRPKPVGEGELAQMRGGFFTANGAQFDFGANITTLVNGQLALQTSLQWTANGAVVHQVTGDGVQTTQLTGAELTKVMQGINGAALNNGVVITGPTGRTEIVANLTAGQIQNLLVNTQSGQTITQNTDVQLTIYNFSAWQQQILQQTIGARLANDVRAAAALGSGH